MDKVVTKQSTTMNYKNLNYEIETTEKPKHPGAISIETPMNYKNLNYEIETLYMREGSLTWGNSMNYKNLNYEIETVENNSCPG